MSDFRTGRNGALVGRSCFEEGIELRKFIAQQPRAEDEARKYGVAFLISWILEKESPPLDKPPDLCEKGRLALQTSADRIPSPETPLDPRKWDFIPDAIGELLTPFQSLSRSPHFLLAKWRATCAPTRLTQGG